MDSRRPRRERRCVRNAHRCRELSFERVHVRPEGRYPVGGECVLKKAKLLRPHVRRRKIEPLCHSERADLLSVVTPRTSVWQWSEESATSAPAPPPPSRPRAHPRSPRPRPPPLS